MLYSPYLFPLHPGLKVSQEARRGETGSVGKVFVSLHAAGGKVERTEETERSAVEVKPALKYPTSAALSSTSFLFPADSFMRQSQREKEKRESVMMLSGQVHHSQISTTHKDTKHLSRIGNHKVHRVYL